MDPTESLYSILEMMFHLRNYPDSEIRSDIAYELRSLSKWIDRGGFMPQIRYDDGEKPYTVKRRG